MATRNKVKCPECGETKISRGAEFFRHCGSKHKISENFADDSKQGEPERADPDQVLEPEQEVQEQMTQEQEQQESTGEPDQEQEHDYSCGNCGNGFDRKLLQCSDCGKKFNWGAMQ